jgi:signal transduction histidine kinase
MSSGSNSDDAGPLRAAVGLDAAHREQQLEFFQLGPEDDRVLQAQHELARQTVDGIVAEFYDHLLSFPPLAELLRAEPDRIARLRPLQRAHFMSLFEGAVDEAYFESRLRVGDAHQRIGLEPSWYIGAFALYLRLALRALTRESGDGARILPIMEALVKRVFLDMSLAMSTYIYGGFVSREVAATLRRAAQMAEETLAARREVEGLKSDLTNMVVHDLKNPVNGIAMMVQLALRKGAELPETHRGYLQQIDRTCREMMRLIQNLLEISKIEEGKMPVAAEPIVLAELVDEVVAEYGPVAEQTGRHLQVDVGTDLPAARGDRAIMKRVLVNLVVNALRHSGSDEVRIEGTLGPDADEITLGVRDRGRGIAAVDHARVFEKFRILRRSPTDDPAVDTGLGLPFCKLAVEQMGGRIALTSRPDDFTLFAVTLPLHRPPA